MNLLHKLQNLVQLAFLDVPGQFKAIGGLFPDTQIFEPQGLHFAAPPGSRGVLLSPQGQTSNAVAVGVSNNDGPSVTIPGEGGLHFLGAWKVYLAADGSLALGAQVPTDFVALATKVDAALNAILVWANAHVHTSAAPGSPTSPTVAPLAALAPVGSLTVKCA